MIMMFLLPNDQNTCSSSYKEQTALAGLWRTASVWLYVCGDSVCNNYSPPEGDSSPPRVKHTLQTCLCYTGDVMRYLPKYNRCISKADQLTEKQSLKKKKKVLIY